MKLFSLAAGAAALALTAQAALAADAPVRVAKTPAAVAAPMFNWTGFYGGVHAGYGWGDARITPLDEENKHRGWVAGGQLGFNVQSGSWVWGAEIDGAWSNIDNDGSSDCDPCGYVRIRDLITARLRTGPAIGNTFYYLHGGWAGGKVKYNDFDAGEGSLSKRHSGYTAGIGAEHAFAPNASVKLEYLYVDLGKRLYDLGTPDDVDVRTHIVRIGLNWRFASGVGKTPAPVVTKY
jgi:outer membrane immunogenic protein